MVARSHGFSALLCCSLYSVACLLVVVIELFLDFLLDCVNELAIHQCTNFSDC